MASVGSPRIVIAKLNDTVSGLATQVAEPLEKVSTTGGGVDPETGDVSIRLMHMFDADRKRMDHMGEAAKKLQEEMRCIELNHRRQARGNQDRDERHDEYHERRL